MELKVFKSGAVVSLWVRTNVSSRAACSDFRSTHNKSVVVGFYLFIRAEMMLPWKRLVGTLVALGARWTCFVWIQFCARLAYVGWVQGWNIKMDPEKRQTLLTCSPETTPQPAAVTVCQCNHINARLCRLRCLLGLFRAAADYSSNWF